MDKRHFVKLLGKYLKGNATNAEQQFLFNYYNLFEDEPDVFSMLNDEKKQDLQNKIDDNIWLSINQRKASDTDNIRSLKIFRTRIAAAAIILLTIGVSLLVIHNRSNTPVLSAKNHRNQPNRLLHLPDGSIVIVTAESKFSSPASFDGLAKREVYLEGEAYFDIKHNPAQPFIVHTGKVETRVLGTAFNINAWPVKGDITVTVARGKVKINDQHKILGTITLNQQLIYNKAHKNAIQKEVNSDHYMAWEKMDLFCDNITVEEAGILLKQKFNVAIINYGDDRIKAKRFTTTLLKNEPVEKLLESICEFSDAEYAYDKEKSIISINSK